MFARRAVALVGIVILVAFTGSVATARGRDRTPPITPTNLRITASTSTSVSLAWNSSSDNSGSFSYVVKAAGCPSR